MKLTDDIESLRNNDNILTLTRICEGTVKIDNIRWRQEVIIIRDEAIRIEDVHIVTIFCVSYSNYVTGVTIRNRHKDLGARGSVYFQLMYVWIGRVGRSLQAVNLCSSSLSEIDHCKHKDDTFKLLPSCATNSAYNNYYTRNIYMVDLEPKTNDHIHLLSPMEDSFSLINFSHNFNHNNFVALLKMTGI